jgi:bacterioferritin-associated ferredoxin
MYLCLCNAVTEDDVLDAVSGGAGCVRSICRATRAASTCGACFRSVQGFAAEAIRRRPQGFATPA